MHSLDSHTPKGYTVTKNRQILSVKEKHDGRKV